MPASCIRTVLALSILLLTCTRRHIEFVSKLYLACPILLPLSPPPSSRFAPPGERRPPKTQRVSIQSVTPGDAAAGGGASKTGGFVKRLAGSFQRLHGAYVSLETLPEVDSPSEAGRYAPLQYNGR